MKPMDTSYETIWAADRRPPRKAYFELDDHPDMMIPKTDKEEMANKYNTPTFKSEKTIPCPNGITAQPTTERKKVKIKSTRKRGMEE